ncbi:MAG: homoserine dehydrogenase [Planctomycetota bacterium]
MKKVNVGVVGFGVVGSGVVKILRTQRKVMAARTGVDLVLKKVVTKDLDRTQGVKVPKSMVSFELDDILSDESIEIVVQVVGGTTVARTIMEKLIRAGKHVVTANKALLAEHGRELFALAGEHGVAIQFGAAVAGGIPVIGALHQGYLANNITSIIGILNGTSNYILTRMLAERITYDDALAEAQAHGYAEADPTLDVGGGDAAHKLIILARCGMGVDFDARHVHVEGITHVQLHDILFADELGYRIKLLAIAKHRTEGLELRVHPTLVSKRDPLAHIPGNFNAIEIDGDAVGPTMLYGQGAGQMPTASAVVSDVIHIGMGRAQLSFDNLSLFPDRIEQAPMVAEGDVVSSYYMRLQLSDKPGVLAAITRVFGENNISIQLVSQKSIDEPGGVPVVMMTHPCRGEDMSNACRAIGKLRVTRQKPCLIRVRTGETDR